MLTEMLPETMAFGVKVRNAKAEQDGGGARTNSVWSVKRVLAEMRGVADKESLRAKIAGMRRFGIEPERPIGLTTPQLRALAREIKRSAGPDQPLAEALWKTGFHEARILATLIGDPRVMTRAAMEAWVRDFSSWDVCDACCCNLFDRSSHAWSQIAKWAPRQGEFVRRAAFAMIAAIAVHDKSAPDAVFLDALALIEKYSFDDRNFVRKAVNWALRNIGKRNSKLRQEAIACAERVRAQGTRAARWIAADALRELKAR